MTKLFRHAARAAREAASKAAPAALLVACAVPMGPVGAAAQAKGACVPTGNALGDVGLEAEVGSNRQKSASDPGEIQIVERGGKQARAGLARGATEQLDCKGQPDLLVARARTEAFGDRAEVQAEAGFAVKDVQTVTLEQGIIGVLPIALETCSPDAERETFLSCEWGRYPSGGTRGRVGVRASYVVTVDGATVVDVPLQVESDANGRTVASVGQGWAELSGFRPLRLPGVGEAYVWDDTTFTVPGGVVEVFVKTEAGSTVGCLAGGTCLVGVADLTDPPWVGTTTGGGGQPN